MSKLVDEGVFRAEVIALLDYLELRKLSESEACAIMGATLQALLRQDPQKLSGFCRLLQDRANMVREH